MTALVLSLREAAKLLHIDRGSTLLDLIRAGRLRPVPWGRRQRIPLEEVQRLAREGFSTADGEVSRVVSRPRRVAAAPAGRIRDAVKVEP